MSSFHYCKNNSQIVTFLHKLYEVYIRSILQQTQQFTQSLWKAQVKGKVFQYLFPSAGPRANPGVQAAIHLVIGCQYFPPGLQSHSKLKSITTHKPVPNYTAWWLKYTSVNSLSNAVTWNETGHYLLASTNFWVANEWSTVMQHRPFINHTGT